MSISNRIDLSVINLTNLRMLEVVVFFVLTTFTLLVFSDRLKTILSGKLEQRRLAQISKSKHQHISSSSQSREKKGGKGDGKDDNDGDNEEKIEVSSIHIHPIKSLRAISVQNATFNGLGLEGDRTLMIARPSNSSSTSNANANEFRFLTQRQCPALATIIVSLPTIIKDGKQKKKKSSGSSSGSGSSIKIQLSDSSKKEKVMVDISPKTLWDNPVRYQAGLWDESVEVVDVGDKAASFIQSIIVKYNKKKKKNDGDNDDDDDDDNNNDNDDDYSDLRVVAQLPNPHRRVDARYCPAATVDTLGRVPKVSLTDGFPILIASEESLQELNRRLEHKGKDAISMSRFRPNIVVKGLKESFGEDYWKAIQIGGIHGPILHIVKGCPRCKQSCTDQMTGVRFDEPLETLKDFRALNARNKEDVYFAQNVVLQPGSEWKGVKVGDPVKVLTKGDPIWDIDAVQAE